MTACAVIRDVDCFFILTTLDERLPFTTLPSFGIMTTNFTNIDNKRFRLNLGLDNEQTLARYAVFFNALQTTIEKVMQEATNKDPREIDLVLEERITNLSLEF